MMTNDEAKAFCQDWLAAWTGNHPIRLHQFYTSDAYYRDPANPDGLRGDDILPYFRKLLAKNPAWMWKTVEVFPTQNGFCLKWIATVPVGEQVVYETGVDIVELEAGKISHNEVYFDRTALLSCLSSARESKSA